MHGIFDFASFSNYPLSRRTLQQLNNINISVVVVFEHVAKHLFKRSVLSTEHHR